MLTIFVSIFVLTKVSCDVSQTWTLNVGSQSSLPLYHWWNAAVGSGHGVLALRKDWQTQLKYAHDQIGFKYVRFHGILDDDVGSVNGLSDFSFINIDNVYDYILSIGMKPFVEISFMPEAFASSDETVCHYKGNISPPNNWLEWNNFISYWMIHLIERYGIVEISEWYFEVWNEPNCGFYITTPCCGCTACGTFDAYFQLYNNTVTSIKAVNSDIRVGGPATAFLCWISNFTALISENNIPMDFVSTHAYPTDPEIDQNNQMESFYENLVLSYNSQMFSSKLEMVLSEYNSGLYFGNPELQNHDSEFASSFLLYMIPYLQGVFTSTSYSFLSYWCVSDVFQEAGFQSPPFSNVFGLQTIRGIPKPAFRLLELVHKFDSLEYFNASPNDASFNKTVQIFGVMPYSDQFVLFASNFNSYEKPISNETISINVTFSDVSSINLVNISVYKIDKYNSNAYTKWLSIGSPTYPTQEDFDSLMTASQIVKQLFNGQMNVYKNELELIFSLDAYGCVVIECGISTL